MSATVSRRGWLRWTSAAAGASWFSQSLAGWPGSPLGTGRSLAGEVAGQVAATGAKPTSRPRSCIVLWMSGGPSQLDTFDPKPGHENGGPVKAISTSVPGIEISEYLPKLALRADDLAIIRSLSTKEGDHIRGTYLMHTGYLPQGPIQYPTLGSLVSRELATAGADLPGFVSIFPNRGISPRAYGPGFLGPAAAPLIVGENATGELKVNHLQRPGDVPEDRITRRERMRLRADEGFAADHPGDLVQAHRLAYRQAERLLAPEVHAAFELDEESAALQDAYGRSDFGRGCLMARRLVERGVPFVEVGLNGTSAPAAIGWDTHADNFNAVRALCNVLDPAWSTLLADLSDRGLLETTTIVWMGEFGRTPTINANTGRDHFPLAWSAVLAGGGIRGGQTYGATSDDGQTVADRSVTTSDLLATTFRALGIDEGKQNISNVGRPIRLADLAAKPLVEVLQ